MNGCIYRTKDGECDLYAEGGKYTAFCDLDNCKGRKMSNADRIRAMTGEELADKFEEIQLKTVKAYGNDDLLLKGELKKYWLDWLKQECADG